MAAERPGRIASVLRSVLPSDRAGDELTILTGAGLNVIGLVIAVIATFGSQIVLTRVLGPGPYGVVYLTTQVAFVGAAFTRFGMDMAAVREVAIAAGAGEVARARGIVTRAAAIAAGVSALAALGVFALAGVVAGSGGIPASAEGAFRAAALGLPFVALSQVYLGGTRGLKRMQPTLLIYWAGQPLAWIALILVGFAVSRSAATGTLAYSASWILATAAAVLVWRRETAGFGTAPVPPGETRALLRYGAPRAPAALFAQLLFVADLFVLARYAARPADIGVYAAASRVSLLIVVFLTSVSLVFSPFVADLHARGERARLASLFQLVTRATFALTVPLVLVLLVLPGPVLRLFGAGFASDQARHALVVLIAGQTVNVMVGSVGFVLVMVGRTGWDAMVYTASIALDLALAFWLVPRHGLIGAAAAQAVTLALSNGLRVWLVWRILRIQPFTRDYVRLAIPALAGAAGMAAAHVALRGGAWPIDLAVSALAGTAVYIVALVSAGLPAAERNAVRRVLRGLRGRPAEPAPEERPPA
jgi:O-antigen/teichoic acid export membrane protein